eukprot:SAG31_NODE_16002_length_727_cov_4.428344_1_plen_129_part_10
MAIRELLYLGESTVSGSQLRWVSALLVMLLGWFRADTVAGLTRRDVRFARDGSLLITLRRMKGRREFQRQPGLVQIPPAPDGHPRQRILDVIRATLLLDPDTFTKISGAMPAPSQASRFLTEKFRELVP